MDNSTNGELNHPLMGLLTRRVYEDSGCLFVEGSCVLKLMGSKEHIDTDKLRIDVPSQSGSVNLSFGRRYGITGPGGISFNSYSMSFDIEEIKDFDIQNRLTLCYDNKYYGRVLYSAWDLKRGRNKNSDIFIHDGMSIYFRQNIRNSMFLTVRDSNQYDYPEGKERIYQAHKKAQELKDKDIILLFEKKCSKYEESASVLYEKLIDMGYDNAYFIVDKSIPAVQKLSDKYKKNLIEKDSDRHLEYFFASNKFISTETIEHALQLRIANKYVQDKLTRNVKDMEYIFLQHGPTYMVSLNKDLRNGFRKKENYKLHKTIVSSELEAEHFMELGGMQREDLYITGMAKFDRSIRNEGADKIVIMPTWRRWELNQARDNLSETDYFGMIRTMYNAVPDELRAKIVILPHPLMADRFVEISNKENGQDAELCRHIFIAESYDEVLRDCEILITDYSSISYDAYFRGAKIIFYWAEKDECMMHYGEGTHLMLNLDNVFGPVAMNKEDISNAIAETYGKEQDRTYLQRYRKIIEFHDGRNTERIVEHLIADGVIPSKTV